MPVHLRETPNAKYGAWMLDPKPSSYVKVWVTYGLNGSAIIEYTSLENFKYNKSPREISLLGSPYYGTGHVVYEGFFYYQWADNPKIVRFDLSIGQATTVRTVPDMIHKPTASLKRQGYLYQSQSMFVHFNADQNGLWVIYANEKTEKISVALLNTVNLDIINSVKIDMEVGSKGGAFIACGRLFTLKHHDRKRSFLDEEYDLWLQQTKRIRIGFNNPFGDTTMLFFDHNSKQILSWDDGRQLTSPLLLK